MTRILTPDEFIIRAVNAYPSLYGSPTYEEAKFRIFDHIFNTIGNGVRKHDFVGTPVTERETDDAQKWFCCSEAAYGYSKTRQLDDCNIQMPDSESLECVVPVDEMKDHPNIVYWVEFDTSYKRIPYPNFKKTYSLVWKSDPVKLDVLGPKWIEGAIWFYSKCLEYFNDTEACSHYSVAFPKATEDETENTVEQYKKFLCDVQKYPTNEDISKAYECEFIGDRNDDADVAAFISRRWDKEHAEILAFIEETLGHLKGQLHE